MSHDHSTIDMSSSDTTSHMQMTFFTSTTTPLYSNTWTPTSPASCAGTCIFLVFLAVLTRCLLAGKHILEQRWAVAARKRRYVVVRGVAPASERVEADPDAKEGSLITARGVEERVKVVQSSAGKMSEVVPWRWSVDLPRAALMVCIVGVGYLLMLAVMTMNIGYFLSVLAGVFVGELAVGRYVQYDDH